MAVSVNTTKRNKIWQIWLSAKKDVGIIIRTWISMIYIVLISELDLIIDLHGTMLYPKQYIYINFRTVGGYSSKFVKAVRNAWIVLIKKTDL